MQQRAQYGYSSIGAPPASDPLRSFDTSTSGAPVVSPSNYAAVPFEASYQTRDTVPHVPQSPSFVQPTPSLVESFSSLSITPEAPPFPQQLSSQADPLRTPHQISQTSPSSSYGPDPLRTPHQISQTSPSSSYGPAPYQQASQTDALNMSHQELYTSSSYQQSSQTDALNVPPQGSYTSPSNPYVSAPYYQPSQTDALNMPHQGSNTSLSSPYVPTVPSYEQSYNQHPTPPGVYNAPVPLLSSNHSTTGHPFPSMAQIPPGPTGPPQGYDSYSLVPASYGASSQRGYDYRSPLPQNIHEPVGGIYDQPRSYDKPTYSQQANPYDRHGSSEYQTVKSNYEFGDNGIGEVFAYDGGSIEPYGAHGTGDATSWRTLGSISSPVGGSLNIPKAIAKIDRDEKDNGVQKYRVKMLSDSSNGPMDVLCQIGLDGVRMFSPSSGKIVKIYPLDSIMRWEVNDPSVFTFWAKSAVDIEPRRIRLQSGSYTTNAILDTLTAACVQFSEMVGKGGSLDSSKVLYDTGKASDLVSEKKSSNLTTWMTLRNRQNLPEERDHWVPDEAVARCSACSSDFGAFVRRHHCRNCGDIFCDKCTHGRIALTTDEDAPAVRVCDRCLAEVTQRLNNAKQLSAKPVAPRSHDDLTKKLQEELERNAPKKSLLDSGSSHGKGESGQTVVFNCSACGSISLVSDGTTRCSACGVDSSSNSKRERGSVFKDSFNGWSKQSGPTRMMKEVACPTCTVHLQVQVPNSGTETVECEVCQHPFIVSAR